MPVSLLKNVRLLSNTMKENFKQVSSFLRSDPIEFSPLSVVQLRWLCYFSFDNQIKAPIFHLKNSKNSFFILVAHQCLPLAERAAMTPRFSSAVLNRYALVSPNDIIPRISIEFFKSKSIQRPTCKYDIIWSKFRTTDDRIFIDTFDIFSCNSSMTWGFQWLIIDCKDKTTNESRSDIGDFTIR